jgi:predicted metal-dependent hydrolase
VNISSSLQLGDIEASVIRKRIKNLHVSVLPPAGKVRITVPEGMKDDAVRTLLATRLSWIRKQQGKFTNQERQTKRNYVSGESHFLWGKNYRLELVYQEGAPRVFLKGKSKIVLQVRPHSSTEKRAEVMNGWYRAQLLPKAQALITKWDKRIGASARHWAIKKMKTRWGTCNHKKARILLNLELAKKPITCLEYVVVHELVHILENKHSQRFSDLMSLHLPKWRSIRDDLNRFILSYEEWNH